MKAKQPPCDWTVKPIARLDKRSGDRTLVDALKAAGMIVTADVTVPERLVVRPAAAQRMLGIGSTKFWKLVKAEEIPVARIGPRLTMVPIAGLHKFIERHAVAASDPELEDVAD